MIGSIIDRYIIGDCRETLRTLPDGAVQCCVTSPPYWGLRDYGHPGQLGLEPTPDEYVANMVGVFHEVKRVLRDDGTLWLNIGDSYAMSTKGSSGKGEKQRSNEGTLLADRSWKIPDGLKPKDLVGIPWRLAFALQADGWYLRSDIIWHKPNPMPESVTDRPTKAHEYLFLLAKSERYAYDAEAIKESAKPESAERYKAGYKAFGKGQFDGSPTDSRTAKAITPDQLAHLEGRNCRTVWTISTESYSGAHFATMPQALVTRCILAGCPVGGTVLDPFFGSGTVGQVAERLGQHWFGCELNERYACQINNRTKQKGLGI